MRGDVYDGRNFIKTAAAANIAVGATTVALITPDAFAPVREDYR